MATTMDSVVAAMELQYQLAFRHNGEKQREVKIYNDKIRADKL